MNTIHMTVGQRKIGAAGNADARAFWSFLTPDAAVHAIRPDRAVEASHGVPERLASVPVSPKLAARIGKITGGETLAMEMLVLSLTAALVARVNGTSEGLLWLAHETSGETARLLPCQFAHCDADTLKSMLQHMAKHGAEMIRFRNHPYEALQATAPGIAVAVLSDAALPDTIAEASVFIIYRLTNGEAQLEFHARREEYSAATGQRFCDRLLMLAEASIANLDVPLGRCDLQTDEDRRLIDHVNATAVDLPASSLTELFDITFDRLGEEIAIVTDARSHSYSELEIHSRQVASELLAAQLGHNPVIGVVARRSFETIAVIVGILRAGGAYMPIDPSLPIERVRYILEDSGAAAVFCQHEHREAAGKDVAVFDLLVRVGQPIDHASMPVVAPGDAAYLIYTSGSTGRPKGVVIEHDSVVNRLKWMQAAYPISRSDRLVQKTPLTFDVSVWELFWWLTEGASLVVPGAGAEKDPSAIADVISRHGVTIVHFVPTMLGAFLGYIQRVGESDKLATLRTVFASGEALQPHHAGDCLALLSGARLVNLYGPTEATVDVSHFEVKEASTVIPIGQPIANTGLHVLDSAMAPCGVGMVGELYISGRGVGRGYIGRPELTAERFITAGGVAPGRLYKTGDLARWRQDGMLEYLGRNDSQVKLRGYRIELGEIETLLAGHPDVSESVAIVALGSDGQQHLWAYVVGSQDVGETVLKSHLSAFLPEYMVPERIVRLDAFPLSPNGKLDRKALPTPDTSRGGHVAPQCEAECILAGIWEEVLGIEGIGVTENFFSLGGNSIHFVSVLAKARTHGFSFSFQQLFLHPTIRELLADSVDLGDADVPLHEFKPFELLSDADRARIPAGIADAYPMSMLQSGLIYQSEIMYGNTSYHDIVSFLIQGSIDPEIFTKAVGILVADNPIFRTSYRLTEHDEYLQYVHEVVEEIPIFIEDVRGIVSEEEWDDHYDRWFEKEQGRPFDWEKPGLVRLHIHILSDDLFRYSISQHNSMLDGWSMNLVHVKLFEIFHCLQRNEPYASLGADTHLRNFIGMERRAIQSPKFRSFWKGYLDGAPKTDVPRLRAPIEERAIKVAFRDINLPEGLSANIVRLAQTMNVPVKTILLAAHLRVLTTLAGQADVFTGYEIGGRPELQDADRALGVFLNTMPFRMKLQPGTWRDLIRQTFRAEADVLPYRRYPMAQVKQDQGRLDILFETVFNFTHFYSLKKLKSLPEFSLLDVRAAAITEFPLRVEVSQHFYTDEVQVSLHYHTASFDESHILRIGGYFVEALSRMVGDPERPHHDITLVSEGEQKELEALAHVGGEQRTVLDEFGQPAPVGTLGFLAGSEQRARRMPDGSVLGPATVSASSFVLKVEADEGEQLTAEERDLASVWREILGGKAPNLSRSTDFFEVGGNSLLALRLVLKLGGRLSLRDLMGNSRLSEMATKMAGLPVASADDPMLVRLAGEGESGKPVVICLPYAGGESGHFRPLARALSGLDQSITVLAAELPGHTYGRGEATLLDFEATVSALVQEIVDSACGPVYLWGHCVGSALALAIGEALEMRSGVDLRHVFIAAKALPTLPEIEATLDNARRLSFDDIRDLYRDWSGEDGLAEVGKDFETFMAKVFQHDSLVSNGYLRTRMIDSRPFDLSAGITLIASADDPATQQLEVSATSWDPLVPSLTAHTIPEGGHYFARTQCALVASLIHEVISGAGDPRPPEKDVFLADRRSAPENLGAGL